MKSQKIYSTGGYPAKVIRNGMPRSSSLYISPSKTKRRSNAIALFCEDIFVSPVFPKLLTLRHKT